MQVTLSTLGMHRNTGEIWAFIYPWLFNITKANWLSRLIENHVFSRRTETKSKVFQPTVWFFTIQQNSSSLRKTEHFIEPESTLKGNPCNECLPGVTASLWKRLEEVGWNCIFRVNAHIPLGKGENFSVGYSTKKQEIGVSDADSLVLEVIAECAQQGNHALGCSFSVRSCYFHMLFFFVI